MSADGSIKIQIEVADKQVTVASKALDELAESGRKSGQGVESAEDSVKGVGKESGKASISIKKLATSLGLVAVGAAAFNTLRKSMGAAIERFDTLNKFPKVLQSMGVSAEDSERAMTKLSDGIEGLPTTLSDISSSAQDLYASFKDIDLATDTAIALNNALLGSGASAADAERGAQQYTKALQTGEMQLDTFTTLQETMGLGLDEIAKEFGITGRSARQNLYKALKDGTITMDEFNAKLIEVGTGTGKLAKLAKQNSLGIGTSLANLRNAAVKGLADILKSFNKLAEDVTGKDISQNIDSLKHVINAAFRAIGSAIERTTPYVKAFGKAVMALLPALRRLSPVLIGMATAFAIHTVINKTTDAIKRSQIAMALITTVQKAYTMALNKNSAAQVANATATKAKAIQQAATETITKALVAAELLFTGQVKLSTVAMLAKAAAAKVSGTAIKLMTGPIGWATLAVGGLVGAVVGIVKWFNKTGEESEKLGKKTDELKKSISELNNQIDENAQAHKESLRDIEANKNKNLELMQSVQELANQEHKSATEKQLMKSYIDELNESVDGLNLSYNEQADALSMSSEEMEKQIELMAQQERFEESMQRQLEIKKEQMDIDLRLGEITELEKEYRQAVEDKGMTAKEAGKLIGELKDEQGELVAKSEELAGEYDRTMKVIEEATRNGVNMSKEALQEWIEKNEELLGSMNETYNEIYKVTTDAFDKISTKSDVSLKEMNENMKHNQKAVEEWGQNQSALLKWAGENGYENFIPYIESMGIDQAGVLNEMVKGLDDNNKEHAGLLKELAETYEKAGETATTGFKDSLGEGMEKAFEVVEDIITQSPTTLRSAIDKADFQSLGESMPEGMAKGADKAQPKVDKAMEDVADKAEKATKTSLEINSPSKVFMRIGESIPEGMEKGIHSSTQQVINKLKDFAQSTVKPFDGMQADFNKIGSYAMSGLHAGINSGSGRVMAAARSIANRVASTMKSALRIHSPSRLFRDDIGKMIPQGLAIGIEADADKVYKALDGITKGMMVSTPEMALGGGHRMMGANMGMQQVTNTVVQQQAQKADVAPQPPVYVQSVLEVDKKQFARGVWRDISEEINRNSYSRARGKGVNMRPRGI